MNIKTFMAAAVIALTAACSPAEEAAEAEVTVSEPTAEANEAVTEEAAVATAVKDTVEAAK